MVVQSCEYVECSVMFLCQAEDGIRDLVRSRGLGDVYKRQGRQRGTQRRRPRRSVVGSDRSRDHQGADLSQVLDLSLIHI